MHMAAAARGAAAVEDDEDAPSPRTLHAAAERLAAYTSEEVAAGAQPMSGRFADLYAEVRHPESTSTSCKPPGAWACDAGSLLDAARM